MPRAVPAALAAALLAGCVAEGAGSARPAPRSERLEAQINLARGYLESDDPVRALAPLERALAIDPGSADALGLLAVYYQREDELALAEEYYRRALRADGRHARNLNNLAALLVAQGRYGEAIDPLEKLVRDTGYRGRPYAYEHLGLAYIESGRQADGRKALERALVLNPELPVSHLELARLDLSAGALPAATAHYEAFRALSRQTANSLCLGIRLAIATGDTDQQASHVIALRNLYPDSPEATSCTDGR